MPASFLAFFDEILCAGTLVVEPRQQATSGTYRRLAVVKSPSRHGIRLSGGKAVLDSYYPELSALKFTPDERALQCLKKNRLFYP